MFTQLRLLLHLLLLTFLGPGQTARVPASYSTAGFRPLSSPEKVGAGSTGTSSTNAAWHEASKSPGLQAASSAAARSVNSHARTSANSTVVDDTATVFPVGALSGGAGRLRDADSAPPLDLNRAKLMARLTSAAYCSDKEVISSWTCTRCKRVPNFRPYRVREEAS